MSKLINSFRQLYSRIYEHFCLKDYGFHPQSSMELLPGLPETKVLLCREDHLWSTTDDFRHAARNHCAATMLTNCMIVSKDRISSFDQPADPHRIAASIPVTPAPVNVNDPQKIFHDVHRFIGNGPVFRIEKNANRCFAESGAFVSCRTIRRRSFSSASDKGLTMIRSEIDKGHFCGLLVCAGMFAWHWVLAVGYVIYPDGRTGILIEDNWTRKGLSVYFPGEVSQLKGVTVFEPRS